MKKVLMICSAGMSGTILARRVQEQMNQLDPDIEVKAAGVVEGRRMMLRNPADLCVITPPAGMYASLFGDLCDQTKKSILVLSSEDFGISAGEISRLSVRIANWFGSSSLACF